MACVFWLSDAAWAVLETHLPHSGPGRPGRPRNDDRRVVSAILFVLRTRCYWRDVPAEYGPASTVFNQYNRWRRTGVWQNLEAVVAAMEVIMQINEDGSMTLPVSRTGPMAQKRTGHARYIADYQI